MRQHIVISMTYGVKGESTDAGAFLTSFCQGFQKKNQRQYFYLFYRRVQDLMHTYSSSLRSLQVQARTEGLRADRAHGGTQNGY